MVLTGKVSHEWGWSGKDKRWRNWKISRNSLFKCYWFLGNYRTRHRLLLMLPRRPKTPFQWPNLVSSNMAWGHGWQVIQNICKFIYHCPCNPNFHICLNINKEYMLIISGWRINKVNLKAVTVRASEMLSYQSWELHFNLFFSISKELGTCVKIVFGWKT